MHVEYVKSRQMAGFSYFLDAQNNAHSQPMPLQPKIQLPRRTKIISCLPLAVWRAIHAGAKTISATIAIAAMYFAIIKMSNSMSVIFYFFVGAVSFIGLDAARPGCFYGLYTIFCGISQFFFNSKQLVVFRHSVRARHGTGFNLACVCRNRQIRNRRVFGFATAV